MANVSEKFIGRGITFPLVVDKGTVVTYTGEKLVQSSILIILNYAIKTRFFLGEFGSYITTLLEKQNSTVIRNTIDTYVIDPLKQWEPRIENIECEVLESPDYVINLKVSYRIISTQQDHSFIVPFIKEIIY